MMDTCYTFIQTHSLTPTVNPNVNNEILSDYDESV